MHERNRLFLTGTEMPREIGTLWTYWPPSGGIGFGVFQTYKTQYVWSEKCELIKKRGFFGTIFSKGEERKIYFDNANKQPINIEVNNQKLPLLPPYSYGELIFAAEGEYNIKVYNSNQIRPIYVGTFFLPAWHEWKGRKIVMDRARVGFFIFNVNKENSFNIKSATYLPERKK